MRSRLSVNSSEYIHSTSRLGLQFGPSSEERSSHGVENEHAQSCSGFDTAEYDWGRAQLPHQEDRLQLGPLLHAY
jgi:hypothetical protein